MITTQPTLALEVLFYLPLEKKDVSFPRRWGEEVRLHMTDNCHNCFSNVFGGNTRTEYQLENARLKVK